VEELKVTAEFMLEMPVSHYGLGKVAFTIWSRRADHFSRHITGDCY